MTEPKPPRWDLQRVYRTATRLGFSVQFKCPDTEGRYLHFHPMLMNWLPHRVDMLSLDPEKTRQALAMYDAIREALRRELPGAWERVPDGSLSHPSLAHPLLVLPRRAKEAAAALNEFAAWLEENPDL